MIKIRVVEKNMLERELNPNTGGMEENWKKVFFPESEFPKNVKRITCDGEFYFCEVDNEI